MARPKPLLKQGINTQPGEHVVNKVRLPEKARFYVIAQRKVRVFSSAERVRAYPVPTECTRQGYGYVVAFERHADGSNRQVKYSRLIPERQLVVSNTNRYPPDTGQQLPYRRR
ncbi:MAG: hypothetical protein HYY37_02155 [Candidatus Aenigmarchaeota archaeon]|nr:hypothetical protein [Candidatus Aenigmarchaeota archaeon]